MGSHQNDLAEFVSVGADASEIVERPSPQTIEDGGDDDFASVKNGHCGRLRDIKTYRGGQRQGRVRAFRTFDVAANGCISQVAGRGK